jgi:hypothetical protein
MDKIVANDQNFTLKLVEVTPAHGAAHWQARFSFRLKGGAIFHGVTSGKYRAAEDAEEAARQLARRHGWEESN